MAYKCSFIDGVLYGTEDVNEVVGDLVGAGVAPFISKNSYTPSDLNSLTAGLVSSGVQLGGCKVSRVSETEVSVAPGIIYFGNGLRLKVTEAHSITVPENTSGTIIAYYSTANGTGSLLRISSLSIQKNEIYIPLARIFADGTIQDVREFAESKIVTFGTNEIYSIPEDKITVGYRSYNTDGYYKILEIDLTDVNLNRFNYLLYKYADSNGNLLSGYWDFKDNTEKFFFDNRQGNGIERDLKFRREFNKILVCYYCDQEVTNYENLDKATRYMRSSYYKLI